MKTKENKALIKLTVKNAILAFIFVIIILYSIQFYYYYFDNNKSYAKETSSDDINKLSFSNAKKINIDEILNNNSPENAKEEVIKEQAVLEYITKYKVNEDLPVGEVQVIQEGREGKQELTIKNTYENNEIVSTEQLSAKVTKSSIDKIVEVGASKTKKSHKIVIGDTLYTTSDRASIMSEPDENSSKLTTLGKDIKLTLLEINGNWYRISSGSITGWINSDYTIYKAPVEEKVENTQTSEKGKSKSELLSTLSFDMSLNKPSGLTLEQFQKILSDKKDINSIFSDNASYFYYAEKQYNVNGVFLASIGIHESAWGTSQIAKNKNNLFGYGAYDSNPYNGAYTFSNYSESIDLLARVMVKYYLNPAGTKIYDNQTATGSYYNGPTFTGVNTKYASDKNWANAVYTHMKYLYNNL